ncbi:hypothetical protein T09_6221 [Trichinella sp. T9]|nr:hypothetical protein T09_6221 [Trichinella sp. T9]
MPDHGDGHGSTNPNEEDPLKYFMLNSRLQVNHVVVNVTRVCSEDHLVSKERYGDGWRTFFKVKHSMELGFLKTTRSCCHNEICTYIFQSNHQQISANFKTP